jgi:hypothetical protein
MAWRYAACSWCGVRNSTVREVYDGMMESFGDKCSKCRVLTTKFHLHRVTHKRARVPKVWHPLNNVKGKVKHA